MTEGPAESEQPIVPDAQGIRIAYEGVLDELAGGQREADFQNAVLDPTTSYQYFLYDMDQDGTQELVVGHMASSDVFTAQFVRVYDWEENGSGAALVEGSVWGINGASNTGSGLYFQEVNRMRGNVFIGRAYVQSGVLQTSMEKEFMLGDSGIQAFYAENPEPSWMDISDRSGLDSLG